MSRAGFEYSAKLPKLLQELHYQDALTTLRSAGADVSGWDTQIIQSLPEASFPEKPAVVISFDHKRKLNLPAPMLEYRTIGLWASISMDEIVGLPENTTAREHFVDIYSKPGRRLLCVLYPEDDNHLPLQTGWVYTVPDSPPFALLGKHSIDAPGGTLTYARAETSIDKIRQKFGDNAVELLPEENCEVLVNALGRFSVNNHGTTYIG
ncbi:MAG TPA: hypothetical protein VFL85_02375 [Candidatus Saccharimonadales bacterium]|nr:hypothetical protein [Candidatus Saccharimonadales bacterium]